MNMFLGFGFGVFGFYCLVGFLYFGYEFPKKGKILFFLILCCPGYEKMLVKSWVKKWNTSSMLF
jgi:hypothetical protein